MAYLLFRVRWKKKGRKVLEDNRINNYIGFFSKVPCCMYDFLAIFGINGTFMWFISYDLSMELMIPWIHNGFS